MAFQAVLPVSIMMYIFMPAESNVELAVLSNSSAANTIAIEKAIQFKKLETFKSV